MTSTTPIQGFTIHSATIGDHVFVVILAYVWLSRRRQRGSRRYSSQVVPLCNRRCNITLNAATHMPYSDSSTSVRRGDWVIPPTIYSCGQHQSLGRAFNETTRATTCFKPRKHHFRLPRMLSLRGKLTHTKDGNRLPRHVTWPTSTTVTQIYREGALAIRIRTLTRCVAKHSV